MAKTPEDLLNLKTGQTALYPPTPATAQIVKDAVANADVLGARRLGELGGGVQPRQAQRRHHREPGGESTLGNLVAEVQRWATETPETGLRRRSRS